MESLCVSQTMAVLSILVLFLISPPLVLSSCFSFLGPPSYGPNAYAWDWADEGPYVAVEDGRIVKYEGPDINFVDFAYASPFWNKEQCLNNTSPDKKDLCGRTYDLAFNYVTKELYVADCYFHLSVVGPEGGHATQLAKSVNGVPFKWLYALTVDQPTGNLYFTDVSTKYDDKGIQDIIRTKDTTGRVLKYDPSTKEVTLLMKDLHVPGGIEVSKDSSFILVAEFMTHRILKYWLTGPKADTAEVLLKVRGPGNIKRKITGEFWVASSDNNGITVTPRGILFDEFGRVLKVVPIPLPYKGEHIEQVVEHDGKLYVGSLFHSYVGILQNFNHDDVKDKKSYSY
uniref:Strictosidine synthase n=1 Tax=Gelsemium sempervirens TaxID=28542 RepID=A0A346A6F4_GELSE|nr:strictosidine synthase [Gelsemium sempervirens]